MKASAVYLRAAELVERGEPWGAYRFVKDRADMELFYFLFEGWCEILALQVPDSVLGLCLMSAIAAYDEKRKP